MRPYSLSSWRDWLVLAVRCQIFTCYTLLLLWCAICNTKNTLWPCFCNIFLSCFCCHLSHIVIILLLETCKYINTLSLQLLAFDVRICAVICLMRRFWDLIFVSYYILHWDMKGNCENSTTQELWSSWRFKSMKNKYRFMTSSFIVGHDRCIFDGSVWHSFPTKSIMPS